MAKKAPGILLRERSWLSVPANAHKPKTKITQALSAVSNLNWPVELRVTQNMNLGKQILVAQRANSASNCRVPLQKIIVSSSLLKFL